MTFEEIFDDRGRVYASIATAYVTATYSGIALDLEPGEQACVHLGLLILILQCVGPRPAQAARNLRRLAARLDHEHYPAPAVEALLSASKLVDMLDDVPNLEDLDVYCNIQESDYEAYDATLYLTLTTILTLSFGGKDLLEPMQAMALAAAT